MLCLCKRFDEYHVWGVWHGLNAPKGAKDEVRGPSKGPGGLQLEFGPLDSLWNVIAVASSELSILFTFLKGHTRFFDLGSGHGFVSLLPSVLSSVWLFVLYRPVLSRWILCVCELYPLPSPSIASIEPICHNQITNKKKTKIHFSASSSILSNVHIHTHYHHQTDRPFSWQDLMWGRFPKPSRPPLPPPSTAHPSSHSSLLLERIRFKHSLFDSSTHLVPGTCCSLCWLF